MDTVCIGTKKMHVNTPKFIKFDKQIKKDLNLRDRGQRKGKGVAIEAQNHKEVWGY